jgi:hypothetical protein
MGILRFNAGMFSAAGDAILAGLIRFSRFWPLSWRSISAIILGMLLARWTWILFAPHAIYTASVPERPAAQEAERLFGVAVSSKDTTQGVALPNVKLLGVFAASAYKPGFAILKLEGGRQAGVAEGEEVAPGTRLVKVTSDYVLLERAGVQQRVNLENQYVPPAGSKPAGPAYGAAAGGSPPGLPQGRNFKPRMPPTHR